MEPARMKKSHHDRPAESNEGARAFLFCAGWAITLLYFPSGLMHEWLGSLVYARDVLLISHLVATLIFFAKSGRLRSFAKNSWLLLLVPLFMLPAVFKSDYSIEALTLWKWAAMWLDWILLGRLLAAQRSFTGTMWVLAGLTVLLLAADAAAGCYEWKTNKFLFPMRGEVSGLGIPMGKDQHLVHHLRLKGLQRDVFSFANLMGLGCVLALCIFTSVKNALWRYSAFVISGMFALVLFASGGRSALIGIFAAGLLAAAFALDHQRVRRYSNHVVALWLCMAFAISLIGVGEITEVVGSSVLEGSYVGNSNSSYARDRSWGNILAAIGHVPIVLFTGGPLGSYIDSQVDAIYHWADNNYLWLVYHTSVVGLLGVVAYFRKVLGYRVSSSREWARDCCLLFLVFVMGESIAREALTFLGCMPLFVACGFITGSRLRAPVPKIEVRSAIPNSVAAQSGRKRRRRKKIPQPLPESLIASLPGDDPKREATDRL